MIHPRFLKNLPAPLGMLLRPMLFISLGLHGLLLGMPISSQPPELPPEKEPVKVTQLPALPSPQPSPTLQLPTSLPGVKLNPLSPVKPSPRLRQSTPLVVKSSPTIQQPEPSPTVQQPEPSPTLEQVTPSPASPSPIASTTPTPSPTPTPSETPTPSPTPVEEPTPSPTPDDPLAKFPHLDNAQQGCEGLIGCWQVAETQWRSVSNNLLENLSDKDYEVKDLHLENDHVGAFEVWKDGERQYYLYLFPTEKGTVYRITKEPLTHEELS